MNEFTSTQTAIVNAITPVLLKTGKPVLMQNEFRALYRPLVLKSTKCADVEKTLVDAGVIQYRTLKSEQYKDVERVVVPSLHPTPYHYALSLRGNTYLSHGSAVHLLGLTQQQPKTIYVNREQGPKPRYESTISQDAIDRAFSRPQRRSNYIFRIEGYQLVLLSGKATRNAGVVADDRLGLPVTSLERTLIDIAVRPRYAGGVFQVLEAYRTAVGDFDVNRLLALLSKLDYKYPYHQAIGFYLDRAGADDDVLHRLKSRGITYDFYLDYTIASPTIDPSWRVYVPLGI